MKLPGAAALVLLLRKSASAAASDPMAGNGPTGDGPIRGQLRRGGTAGKQRRQAATVPNGNDGTGLRKGKVR